MALKTNKELLYKINEKYGNEKLSSRVLIMKKARKSTTKEVVFLDEESISPVTIKDVYKENKDISLKEEGNMFKGEFMAIKDEIKEINEKITGFIKGKEKEKEDLGREIKGLKTLLWILIILIILMQLKGLFR